MTAVGEEGFAVRVSVLPRGEFGQFTASAVEQSIPDRFEQQVYRFPDRLAVQTKSDRLTYAELDDWSNRIAADILERRGPGQEHVAVLLPQGASAVAAILAVLKAGKVYVPLDPSHPPAGLMRTREWVGAVLVATESSHADLARSIAGRADRVFLVDRCHEGGGERPGLEVSPDDTAYVFFTSGSTGKAKGVYDSHRNVLHNVRRYTNALRIGPDDRLTLLQSCAFSGTVSSLFGALLNGAALFPFDFAREGPGELARLLRRHELTMYHSVPSIFRSFLTGAARFPALRVIRLEGDRASSVDVALARRHFDPECVVANGLGTTETGLCRQYLIDRDTEIGEGILPVGHAVEDMEVRVVDDRGVELEVGEPGEIAVRSRYLALGYWRRPDLTERAFRPDQAGGPERVYRTGDLGRMRPDGNLEYLGRADFQLKVRGNRVDVGDVESCLIAVEGVADAVVTTVERANGEAELVAYVVGASAPPSADELSATLRRTLPGYLVPTRFRVLDELPVDEGGKVDRSALATLQPISPGAGASPRGSLERCIVGIWQDVLDVSPIAIDQSFMELGGDSLSAAVIASRIEAETHYGMPRAAVVETSTVASLAAELRAGRHRLESPLVPLQLLGNGSPLFLVHDLLGEVERFRGLADRLDKSPVYALRYTSEHRTIEGMAARYLHEIQTVQPEGPYRLGGWCFGAVVAFEMAHQLHAAGEDVSLLALIGISAWDFPRLIEPQAWERYQASATHKRPARVRARLSTARAVFRHGRRSARAPEAPCGAAFRRYVPLTYPGRATLILSRDETERYSCDPTADWRRLAAGGVDVLLASGDHADVLTEPNVRKVAEYLGGSG